MEVETNDCVEKENPQEMDEDVFKEHVKLLKWKYGKTVREIEKYTVKTIHWAAKEIDQEKLKNTDNAVKKFLEEVNKVLCQLDENLEIDKFDVVNKFKLDIIKMHVENEAEIKRKFKELKASRLKAVDIQAERSNQQISISKEKSSESPVKVEKAKVDVTVVDVPKIEALAVKKVEVDVPKVEALAEKKVDVAECSVKTADLCCEDEKVAVPNCSAVSLDEEGSAMSDDKVEAVKSVKDDWKYRRNMWWLNFRRKIIYDKIRGKKPCKTVKKNLKVYENGIHKFIDEFKDVKGCDIRGWKKRLSITKTDVGNYVNKLKAKCKVNSRCEVSSRSRPDVKKPDITISSVNYSKVPADDAGMKSRRRMLKAKMVTVSTQTDFDEIAKMSTQVDSTSSQVMSKPCWCRSAKILDMQLFRKACMLTKTKGRIRRLL